MTKSEVIEVCMDYFLEHFPASTRKAGLEFVTGFVSELQEQGVVDLEEDYDTEEEPLDVEW